MRNVESAQLFPVPMEFSYTFSHATLVFACVEMISTLKMLTIELEWHTRTSVTYDSIMALPNNPKKRFEKDRIKCKYISNLAFA